MGSKIISRGKKRKKQRETLKGRSTTDVPLQKTVDLRLRGTGGEGPVGRPSRTRRCEGYNSGMSINSGDRPRGYPPAWLEFFSNFSFIRRTRSRGEFNEEKKIKPKRKWERTGSKQKGAESREGASESAYLGGGPSMVAQPEKESHRIPRGQEGGRN